MVSFQCSFYLCNLFPEVTQGILEVLSLCNKSGVGLTISCKSDSGFANPLPAGICTGWTRRRGLPGVSLLWGGGGTKVGMGVGALQYDVFGEFWSIFIVVGGLAFLFLFFGGGEANMFGSIGPKSVNGGSLSNREEDIFSSCLDSVSKQISVSKYRCRGLARSSVR